MSPIPRVRTVLGLTLVGCVALPAWSVAQAAAGSVQHHGAALTPIPVATAQPRDQGLPALLTGANAATNNAVLLTGLTLRTGQFLRSSDGQSTAVLQSDGNLVIYNGQGHPLWSTRTHGTGSGNVLAVQPDGNVVLYSRNGRPLWWTGTTGAGPGNFLAMQSDQNLVLYPGNGKTRWASNTGTRRASLPIPAPISITVPAPAPLPAPGPIPVQAPVPLPAPLSAPMPAPAPTPVLVPIPAPIPIGGPVTGPAAAVLTPEQYGARGDGHTDDTAALQQAFDAAPAGATVLLTGTYAHADLLHLRTPGLRVTGPGTLLATDESRSSVWVEADSVLLDGGLIIRTAGTTQRWGTWEQMGVRLVGHHGITLRQVTVDGAAAAGIYVGDQASGFTLDHVTVTNTRADGIHMTGGAHDGQVIAPTILNSGDDGVAVVSYGADGSPCHDITVTSPRVLGTTWGRGLSVVGGDRITETNIDVERSSAAGVYIAAEGAPWFTTAPQDVTVSGGRIVGANTDPGVDHGAVLVMSGETGPTPAHVNISGLRISETRSTASRDVGVISYGTAPNAIIIDNMVITGGPAAAYQGNAPSQSYQTHNWVQGGVALPDHN